MKKIVIVDYGIGNIASVARAISYLGYDFTLTSNPEIICSAAGVIVPGDGAFGDTMNQLRQKKLIPAILEFIRLGKPFLGICVGMQILASESEELGHHRGLDLIPGKVVKFAASSEYKVPQIGWNRLHRPNSLANWNRTILEDLQEDDWVYFIHSYYFNPDDTGSIIALTDYANSHYCSILQKDNIFGCQFHPEKSALVGLKILHSFLKLIS